MDQGILTFPQMLNERQAARTLAVSIAALRRWRRERRGPRFSRLEGCIRYDSRSLESWVTQNSSNNKVDDSQSAGSAGGE
jgi:hypothetical protein